MPETSIGDRMLLFPSVHLAGGESDARPSGILKLRPADFIVHEVGLDGEKVPFVPEEETGEERPQTARLNKNTEAEDKPPNAEVLAILAKFFDAECISRLTAFHSAKQCKPSRKEKASGDNAETDSLQNRKAIELSPLQALTKADRTLLHETIRTAFPILTSETSQSADGAQCIRVRPKNSRDTQRSNAPNRPAYTHFTLRKENIDTARAMGILGKVLHVSPKSLTFSGTKDKRAVTYQRVSARGVEWSRIASVSRASNLQVASPSVEKTPLFLGDLTGNHFTLVIRDLDYWGKRQRKAVELVAACGFINYYGPQRFGTGRTATHTVGIHVVNNELRQALALILEGTAAVSDSFSKSAKLLNLLDLTRNTSEDYEKAACECPQSHRMEKGVLSALAAQPRNFATAWQCIPRNSRRMYVHALQSYVWNRMVSMRIELYGEVDVVVGDVVQQRGPFPEMKNAMGEPTGVEEDGIENAPQVEIVNEDTVSKYSIYDVVMPLPGDSADLLYPTHDCGIAAYRAELSALNAEKMLEDSERGGYRRMLVWPRGLHLAEQEGENAGDVVAVELEFQLAKGSYATSLLREIVRVGERKWPRAPLEEKIDVNQEVLKF